MILLRDILYCVVHEVGRKEGIKKIRTRNLVGPNDITIEVWKYMGEDNCKLNNLLIS